jgi:hypothetical protein
MKNISNIDILFYFNTFLVLLSHGITCPAVHPGETESEQIQRLFYPWIKYHIQGSKTQSLTNGGRGISIKDEVLNIGVFKDSHSNLGRLHGSMYYKIKVWMASTTNIMYNLSAVGPSIGSFGIDLKDRAVLISDLEPTDVTERNQSRLTAFSYIDKSVRPFVTRSDIMIPLPQFTGFFFDDQVSHLMTDYAKEVSIFKILCYMNLVYL